MAQIKIEQQKLSLTKKRRRKVGPDNSDREDKTIQWIENLLQTPIDDYRKFAIWRIVAPYFINIKQYSTDEAFNTIRDWLDKCRSLRQLDFNPNYIIKYNINSKRRAGYLPISVEKLKIENCYPHSLVAYN